MPVYNELRTIEAAISDVLATPLPVEHVELIVIDDGSTDGTREWLASQEWPDSVRLLLHDGNRGKGAALRTGLLAATGTYATVMDADLEYEAASIARLLEPILNGRAEAVYGVRGFESHSAYSFWYVIGNKVVSLAADLIYNSWLHDVMTCHKVLRTELFQGLPLRAPGFAIEAEITARLLRAGVRIYEVPVTYRARTRVEGKKLTARDGVRALITLLRCRVDRRGRSLSGSNVQSPPAQPSRVRERIR
jgi:glycosyltransferase involved in cell wall biosynthesis